MWWNHPTKRSTGSLTGWQLEDHLWWDYLEGKRVVSLTFCSSWDTMRWDSQIKQQPDSRTHLLLDMGWDYRLVENRGSVTDLLVVHGIRYDGTAWKKHGQHHSPSVGHGIILPCRTKEQCHWQTVHHAIRSDKTASQKQRLWLTSCLSWDDKKSRQKSRASLTCCLTWDEMWWDWALPLTCCWSWDEISWYPGKNRACLLTPWGHLMRTIESMEEEKGSATHFLLGWDVVRISARWRGRVTHFLQVMGWDMKLLTQEKFGATHKLFNDHVMKMTGRRGSVTHLLLVQGWHVIRLHGRQKGNLTHLLLGWH